MSTGFFGGIIGSGSPPPPPVLTFSLEVAFTNGPLDPSPTWTDIASDAMSFTTTMGRQHQLDRVEPSNLTAVLNNRAGTYSPWSTLSPYYPLVPGKPVRITAAWNGVSYPIFYGFTDAWTPQPKDELNQDCQLQASDVLKQLNLKYLINPTLYPNTITALSPLLYWRLNETAGVTAVDASGNGRNGSIWGGPTFSQQGAQLYDPNSSVTLANGGTTDYGGSWIVAPTLPNQGAAGHAFSFECWFKTTAVAQQIFTWASNAGTHPTAVWLAVDDSGQLGLFDGNAQVPPWTSLGLGAGAEKITSAKYVDDGTWHHAVVTMGVPSGANSVWHLYLDGASQGTWTGEYWSASDSQPLYVGGLFALANGGGPTSPSMVGTFTGSIDEVAVYGSALSSGTVANNFTVGSYFQNVELTGARIAKALIVAGYGSYPQNLAAGTVLCQAETNTVTQGLAGDYILIANDTENGLLYQDASGVLQFKDRHYPQINASSVTSQATFGDNAGTTFNYDVTSLSIPQDDLDLWPDVKVQRNNGVIQEVVNLTAAAAYGQRTLQRSALLFEQDSDALVLAQWLNYLYAFPTVRVAAVMLSSIFNSGANLPQMLGRALWDAVTIQRQGAGESQLNAMMAIEAVSHTFDSSEPSWKTTFQLSPFEVSAKANAVLILNSSTQGILDTNVVGG